MGSIHLCSAYQLALLLMAQRTARFIMSELNKNKPETVRRTQRVGSQSVHLAWVGRTKCLLYLSHGLSLLLFNQLFVSSK